MFAGEAQGKAMYVYAHYVCRVGLLFTWALRCNQYYSVSDYMKEVTPRRDKASGCSATEEFLRDLYSHTQVYCHRTITQPAYVYTGHGSVQSSSV